MCAGTNRDLPLPAIASIALAGPLFGLGAALVCVGLYAGTHQRVFLALTYTGALVNLFNLIPVLYFDGARAAYALSRLQRALMLAACIILFALMREWVFLLLAAGMAWRLVKNDAPEENSAATLASYLSLLFALGALLYFVPQPGMLVR